MGLDPLCDLGQVLAFLAEVVFHGKVDQVDDRLGGDEAQLGLSALPPRVIECRTNLLVDQLDFRSRPLSISNRLILLQELQGVSKLHISSEGYWTYRLDFGSRLVEQRQHLKFSSSLPHNGLLGNLGFNENIQILLTQLALDCICTESTSATAPLVAKG